jgi:hypothetical protein
MLAALLRCCDNAMRTNLGRRVKLRCAEVLGMIGAVDPARVPVAMPLPDPLCEYRLEVSGRFRCCESSCSL